MLLDIYTLFICELYILGFLTIIYVFAWLGGNRQRELGYMVLILAMTLSAVFLSSLRNRGYHFLPVVVSNSMLLLSYGLMVNILRSLGERPVRYLWLASCLVWPLLCLFPAFYHNLAARIVTISLLCGLYSAAFFFELCRLRQIIKTTFWPAIVLVSIHLLFQIARLVFDHFIPDSRNGAIAGSNFSLYVILESILFIIGLSFTLLAMVNERSQLRLGRMSQIDPLTNTLNRRGFYLVAAEIIRHSQQRPCTAIIFDLDHFKSINDTYGHFKGDEILLDFCQRVTEKIPAHLCFARLGGEEFAAIGLLSQEQATELCEEIRVATEQSVSSQIPYTVSIGFTTRAITDYQKPAVNNLLETADFALYKAKTSGRNRVCFQPAEYYL